MQAKTLEAIGRLTARERERIASSRGAAMDESADKIAALADVVAALGRLGAPHALVGGVAVRSNVDRASIRQGLTDAGLRLTGISPTA